MQGRGFRLRPLNADCDKLAVQSSIETTWLLGSPRKLLGISRAQAKDVGMCRDELKVLRPYGGAPEIEIEPLGDAGAALIAQPANSATVVMRVGRRYRIALDRDESCVLRFEDIQYPRGAGAGLSV
jgi:hypothetical protein